MFFAPHRNMCKTQLCSCLYFVFVVVWGGNLCSFDNNKSQKSILTSLLPPFHLVMKISLLLLHLPPFSSSSSLLCVWLWRHTVHSFSSPRTLAVVSREIARAFDACKIKAPLFFPSFFCEPIDNSSSSSSYKGADGFSLHPSMEKRRHFLLFLFWK